VRYNLFVSATGGPPRLTKLGRYELITRIGQGGMAEVQLALQRGPAGFEKLVVVKLVHESLASQKTFVEMLLDEARVAALVKHPNVVDIYDLGEANGRYFIAMEYLEGEPLLSVLRAGREGKRLDPLSTGRLIADTAEGLDAAHELRSMAGDPLELVHHDISLGNIVVLYTGQVKLVDFGVAKASQSASTKGAKIQGKFSYMAPEKLRGSQGDRRSDIFSLGCVMWEALTLKRLFKGDTDSQTMNQILEMSIPLPSKVNGDVPVEYDRIVMRALDRDPERRQPTAKVLAIELEELLKRRGYGARNDRIAKYMQETFRTHIDARKKLVQEVVSKGSASADIVDAAFSPLLAQGSPMAPEFALADGSRDRAVTPPVLPPSLGVPVPANAFSDLSKPTQISKSQWDVSSDAPTHTAKAAWDVASDAPTSARVGPWDAGTDSAATQIASPSFDVLEDKLATDKAPTVAAGDPSEYDTTTASPPVVSFWHDRRKVALVGSGAGVLVMLAIVLAVAASGGGANSEATPAPVATGSAPALAPSGSDDIEITHEPVIAPAVADAALAIADAGVATPAIVDAGAPRVAPRPPPARPPPERPPPERPPPPNVDGLVKQGLQLYVKGDYKGALAILQKARGMNAGFAPTWRVLGQVYDKLGDRASAKNAFERYLQLAPNAGDAKQIRARLDSK
jgi:serine/threonine-protein kinase